MEPEASLAKTPHLILTTTISVPYPKDPIAQAVLTSALQRAAETFIQAANERDGHGALTAKVKRVEVVPELAPASGGMDPARFGDTPETMPVSIDD